MSRYHTLVFDLDGTIIDSLPGIEFSVREAVARILPGRPVPSLRGHIGPPVREVLRRALGVEDAATLDALQDAFRDSYDRDGWRRTDLFDGVVDTLREVAAQGCRLFVLTNKPAHAAEGILRHLGLSSYFEDVAAPNLNAKPRPKSAAALALKSGAVIRPVGTLLVGDSSDDAAAAAACGFSFAAAAFGYGDAAAQHSYPVEYRLAAFPELLHSIQNPSLI